MNFNYLKPGVGNAASYQVAGIPWYTSSVAPPLSTTSTVVNLPRVTNYVTVKNTSTADDVLRFTFNRDNIVDNTNYITLESGESFSAQLRVTDIHLISDTETPVPFSIIAGLTNIERQEMSSVTPTAPNLLAWVQKQKLIADDPDGSPEGDRFGWSLSLSSDAQIIAIGSLYDEENGGAKAGAVYIFEKSDSGYQQSQKLTASGDADPAEDRFTYDPTFSGDGNTLVIGAIQDEENGGSYAGSAYVFKRIDNQYVQVQKLTASGDADPGFDGFGINNAVSLDGETVAIGSYIDEENGGLFAGSVYVFQSSSLGYQQVQKLTASGDANPASDQFGISVSISQNSEILVIGASGDEENGGSLAGSVYIFQSSSLGYQQVQKLTASGDVNPAADNFGNATSISSNGEILAISAYVDEENGGSLAGSVYIFQSSSIGYQQVQKLTASGDADPAGDWFGYLQISLNSTGDILVVGASKDEENGLDAGSAYIFESGSSGFVQIKKITAADEQPAGDNFGFSVSTADNTIVIGAYTDEDNGGTDAGSAYVFKYTRDY